MEKLECLSRGKIENELLLANALLEWIEMILDGEKLGDFALSFPIVRRVYDLTREK